MTRDETLGVSLAGLVVALVVGGSVYGMLRPTPAHAAGIQWSQNTLHEALELARERETRVLVKFDAEWCTYCRQLEEEVLSQPEGRELAGDLVAVRVDFDDPANRALVERYVILGLPTVLVVTPEGNLVGRVDGYDSREEWLAEAREAVTANDPLPALRDTQAQSPDDGAASFALGEGLLTRGYPEDGLEMLEGAAFMEGEPAANALFLLGRYHHRVRREPATARHYWRELATRFPESDYAAGAFFWYARAESELGRPERGLAVLERHARQHPDDVDAISLVAQFVERYDVETDRAALAARLREHLEGVEDSDERAELEELAAALVAEP